MCDVVTGLGATPELAVAALHANAAEAAQKIGQQTAELVEAAERRGEHPPESETRWRSWEFEVNDVRLTPNPMEGGSSGWVAYGTLAWYSPTPDIWYERYRTL